MKYIQRGSRLNIIHIKISEFLILFLCVLSGIVQIMQIINSEIIHFLTQRIFLCGILLQQSKEQMSIPDIVLIRRALLIWY